MDENSKIPVCVGMILDGNRTWAKNKGLPKLVGHSVGLKETLKNAISFVREAGIKHLAVFLFSTENWGREKEEVAYLMDLFLESMKKEINDWEKEGVRVHFVGQRERFSKEIQDVMKNAEEKTKNNNVMDLWACMSYGGRADIVQAVRALKSSGEEITEESLNSHLWTAGMPDPDMIIRTSGQMRLSGFLTWQTVYSELFFTKTFWPDFSREEFFSMLDEYKERQRRMGK